MKNLKSLTTLLTLLLIPAFTALRAAGEEKKPVPTEIKAEVTGPVNIYVTISLFSNGKQVAAKDLKCTSSFLADTVGIGKDVFKNLPPGAYEVQYESPGYITLIKRVILREGDEIATLGAKMEKGEGTISLGMSPSLRELEIRLEKLEEARK